MKTWQGFHASDFRLEDHEAERLIAAATLPTQRVHVLGLLKTGMRLREWTHLKMGWIDFERGLIAIPPMMKCACADCLRLRAGVWKPKTKNAARVLAIFDEELRAALQDRLKIYVQNRHFVGAETVRLAVARVARKAKIRKPVTPHTLRATFAYQLARVVGPPDLMAYMGWAGLKEAEPYIRAAVKEGAARRVLAAMKKRETEGAISDPEQTAFVSAAPLRWR